jgi:exopolysaccharide production protein ExoQ
MIGLIGAAKVIEGDDFINLLALVCFWSGVASVSLTFISPGLADGGTGDLIGVFSYKGILGQAMALGGLACLHGLRVKTRSRLSSLLMILLFVYVAIKCRSTTSALIILLFYAVGIMMTLLHRGGGARVLGVILLIPLFLAVPVAAISFDSILELLGKDPTLTGRTDIWGYVIPYIYQRPLLGWGYGAFFSSLNPAAWEVANSMHWFAPEAHNGLLDILLGTGVVGVIWFVCLLVRTIRLSLRCMRYDSGMAITCFSCCAAVLVEGIDEQVLQFVTGLAGAFFITSFFCEQTVSRARQLNPVASARFVGARSIRVAAS